MPWLESLFTALLIAGLAFVADRFVVRLSNRIKRRSLLALDKDSLWNVGVLILTGAFRFCVWMTALGIAIVYIPQLEPVLSALQQIRHILWRWTERAFTLTLIDLGGGNRLTFLTLLTIVGVAIAIFCAASFLGRWIKQKVLRRTRIERGSQEAIATLISYVFAIFGCIILLQSLGLNLSSLTVFAGVIGIGFGLGVQELAKNFVSGLALLFEQQLRVGDFVQIEGVEGTIEEISIRSTIIRTQDRLYVVVPNHRFFADNVTNWSYKTPESRIHIPINVAYGTDTLLVTEVLVGVARQDPKVLKYPAPQVWFKRFGESGMEFELLVWINQPAETLPIKSAINFAIDLEFRRRNILVPFPQRELWVHQSPQPVPAPPTDSMGAKAPTNVPRTAKSLPLSKRNLRQLLRGVSYFSHCTNAQLLFLIEQGFRQHYEAQEIIFRERENGECFYLILTGKVEVYSEKLNTLIATLSTGEFFGEISLFTGVARSATVRTLEETMLFVVDRRALKNLMKDYNDLAEQIARSLVERQQALDELGLGTPTAETREQSVFGIRDRIRTLFGL